jgi:hypothetical protein
VASDAIPLAGAAGLAARARRTRVVGIVLGGLAVALAVAAALSAPPSAQRQFLPADTVGFVVLDLSSSIRPSTYALIRQELASIASTTHRFGLVVFSDVAYEALPPGTPARELRPFVRFFQPRPVRYDAAGFTIPPTPWAETFSGGTRMSAGLSLAADLLAKTHARRQGVVLVSDLADDPSDRERVAQSILLLQQRHVTLRVVALDPTSTDRRFFSQILTTPGDLGVATLPRGREARATFDTRAAFPTRLVVLAALAAVALALDILWAQPLAWRRRRTA